MPQPATGETGPLTAAMEDGKFVFRCPGHCPICGSTDGFLATRDQPLAARWFPGWFRSGLICPHCKSLPRERALFSVLERLYPNWRALDIHESSPSRRGVSRQLAAECPHYVASQYDPELPRGAIHPMRGYRSEDLEAQTFDDGSFDVVITQDVFEHLFHPNRAIAEITRTLRPGGAHILTVPMVNATNPSRRRARRDGAGEVVLLAEAQYHANPLSQQGSLVTIDWGYDIVDYLAAYSGSTVAMFCIDDLERGIRATHIEVLACCKPRATPVL